MAWDKTNWFVIIRHDTSGYHEWETVSHQGVLARFGSSRLPGRTMFSRALDSAKVSANHYGIPTITDHVHGHVVIDVATGKPIERK